jgi:hypothetical protein
MTTVLTVEDLGMDCDEGFTFHTHRIRWPMAQHAPSQAINQQTAQSNPIDVPLTQNYCASYQHNNV